MYNKLNSNNWKRHIYNFEDEPPEKKLISDADALIIQLGEKQRNTKSNLQAQLAMKKDFHKATEFRSLTSYISGSSSLQEFNAVVTSSEEIEKLKSCGLTGDEINLLFDYQRGETYFYRKHKNINKSMWAQQMHHIRQQINNSTNRSRDLNRPSRLETELILSEKPLSMETKLYKFAIGNQPNTKELLPHPMDEIKNMEEQFSRNLSPINIKKIRRKARSLQRRVDEIQTTQVTEPTANKATTSLCHNSKWDVKDLSNHPNWPHNETTAKRMYTCKPQNYYTIKDKQIVKINPVDTKEQTRKITIEEIKQIPKFEKYSPGEPSDVLYLKNIASGITEDNLRTAFAEFTNENISSITVMKGKMKGQAFVQMENETAAEKLIQHCNGIVLKNKPIIIQFSKRKG